MSSRERQVSKGPRQRSVTHRGSSVSAGEQGPDHPLHRGAPAAQRNLYPKTLACGRPQDGQVAGIYEHSEHSEESHHVCTGGWVAEGRVGCQLVACPSCCGSGPGQGQMKPDSKRNKSPWDH